MHTTRTLAAACLALAATSCGAGGGATSGAAKPAAIAAPSTPAPARSPSPGQRLITEVSAAVSRGDLAEAAAIVERARQAVPPARPGAELLAYFDATVHAYRGDYGGAAQVMHDHIAKVGATTPDAFRFHDAMIALRTADGDLLGALVECEEMTRSGTLGTWQPPDGDRMTMVRLKESWHRAYLLRMIAQTRDGAERQALIGYAENARRDYAALAARVGGLGDSIAVLDAYFAFCDGNQPAMREAARRVNVAEDDDVEDLYLVQLALDGAGDREAARQVRARIAALGSVTVLTPVFQVWMASDDTAAGQTPAFSPRHPTGTRPVR